MSKTSRASLSILIAVALCLGLVFLSADFVVVLVPTGIVGLFIVNIDPIIAIVMSATRTDELTE